MTFTAVGSPFFAANSSTFSLTPGGVGDLILVQVINEDNDTVFASALSSSNVTWSQMGSSIFNASGLVTAVQFAGKVTSTGTATVTVSWSGSAPSNIRLAGSEFSSTIGSWVLDVQGSVNGDTNTWASLTPATSGELYWGFCLDETTAVAGSTSGYTYTVDPVHGNGMAFNPSCASGIATAPVWGDSTQVFGIMNLVREAGSGPVFRSASSPAKARLTRSLFNPGLIYGPHGTGRVSWNPGAPGRHPNAGPVFRQAATPVQAKSLPSRGGRTRQAAAVLPAVTGPPVYPWHKPVRAPLPQRSRGGRVTSDPGVPVLIPFLASGTGNAEFVPGTDISLTLTDGQPVGATGGAQFTPGTQVSLTLTAILPVGATGTAQNPAVTTVASSPSLPQPVRARIAQTFSKGRIDSSSPGAPVRHSNAGPVFHPRPAPVQARIPRPMLVPRGRISSNPGSQTRQNLHAGPVFQQAVHPARARIPQAWSKGQAGSSPPYRKPPGAAGGRFNIVFPCAKLTGPVAFKLPVLTVSLAGQVVVKPGGPLAVVLPRPKTAFTATVLHQPLKLVLPKPAVSLAAANFNGRFAAILPAVKVHLTGGRDHNGSFSIVFNICSGGMMLAAPEKVRALPEAPHFYGDGDGNTPCFSAGTPFTAWSASSPHVQWITGT